MERSARKLKRRDLLGRATRKRGASPVVVTTDLHSLVLPS